MTHLILRSSSFLNKDVYSFVETDVLVKDILIVGALLIISVFVMSLDPLWILLWFENIDNILFLIFNEIVHGLKKKKKTIF